MRYESVKRTCAPNVKPTAASQVPPAHTANRHDGLSEAVQRHLDMAHHPTSRCTPSAWSLLFCSQKTKSSELDRLCMRDLRPPSGGFMALAPCVAPSKVLGQRVNGLLQRYNLQPARQASARCSSCGVRARGCRLRPARRLLAKACATLDLWGHGADTCRSASQLAQRSFSSRHAHAVGKHECDLVIPPARSLHS